MKKFHDVGYKVKRDDGRWDKHEYRHLYLDLVVFNQEDTYCNGDTLLNLSWQSSVDPYKGRFDPDGAPKYWYGPRLSAGGYVKSDGWDILKKAVKVAEFVLKHFGYYVEQETAEALPSDAAIDDTLRQLSEEKDNWYSPSLTRLDPRVLLYVGLEKLNIPRVVYDGRLNEYVRVDDLLSPNIRRYQARHNDMFLADSVAETVQEAKQEIFYKVIQELDAIENGGKTTQVFHYEYDKYKAAAEDWIAYSRAVHEPYGCRPPTLSTLDRLLDYRSYWPSKVQL